MKRASGPGSNPAGNENPLFIPEARRDVASVAKVFYAIGKHNALCYAPFGIEDFLAPPGEEDASIDPGLLMSLNIDFSAFNASGTGPYLSRGYESLGNMLGVIQKYRGTGKMTVLSFPAFHLTGLGDASRI